MSMIDHIRKRVAESIRVKQDFSDELLAGIRDAAVSVIEAYRNHGKVIFMGNGGSAADAQHLAAELVGRFAKDRAGLPALALHANTSSLTALSNDYDFDQSYSKQIEAFADPGDIVVGLSTSGRSKNIVKAMERAREKGAVTVALTGASGGDVRAHADILLNVPSDSVARIQEAHILIGHIICEMVESSLFP